jgi:hypothetical protein
MPLGACTFFFRFAACSFFFRSGACSFLFRVHATCNFHAAVEFHHTGNSIVCMLSLSGHCCLCCCAADVFVLKNSYVAHHNSHG